MELPIRIGKVKIKLLILMIIFLFLETLNETIKICFPVYNKLIFSMPLIGTTIFCFSYIFAFIPEIINKKRSTTLKDLEERRTKEELKIKGKDYERFDVASKITKVSIIFIIFTGFTFYLSMITFDIYLNIEHSFDLYSVGIILIVIGAKIIFNSIIYDHKFFSISLFILFELAIEIKGILKDKTFTLFDFALRSIYFIFDSISFLSFKWLMLNKFFSYFKVIYLVGIISFIFLLISMIISNFIPCSSKFCTNGYFFSFSNLYKNVKEAYKGNLLKKIVLTFINCVYEFFKFLLQIKIIESYEIDYYLLMLVSLSTIRSIFNFNYYSLIFSILKILVLLVYLEVIEIKLFGLDRFTKRALEIKFTKEIEESDSFPLISSNSYDCSVSSENELSFDI